MSLDAFWMTALGLALPMLGTPLDVIDKSGFTRVLRTCGNAVGEVFVTGMSHEVLGEVFVSVHVDTDFVSSIFLIGERLEGDALFDVDVCRDPPPQGAPAKETGGRDIVVDSCVGAISIGVDGASDALCSMLRANMLPIAPSLLRYGKWRP